MAWSKCAMGGTCTSQQGSVVSDSNWRWLHTTDGYVNCYTGNEWDAALCPYNAECATTCCLDGADYGGTYGATTNGDALTLKFVTEGEFSTSIRSRLYLLEWESKYQGLTLLGNEFNFDVDVSNLE
jgi:cellulose 1,4-beta-cellobiosidase